MNFELILTLIVILTGIIALLDCLVLARRRKINGQKQSLLVEYSRSFFPVLLFVFIIRSFLIEPFQIPSGSLKPSLLVGDFVLTNKFTYGLRLPVIGTKIVNISQPKRGDIIVLRWPPDPSIYYIKRLIGLPGDHISYKDKILIINGKPQPQTFEKYATDQGETGNTWPVEQKQENLSGLQHAIYIRADVPSDDFEDLVVPAGHYFMMGDNRDDSFDSRGWGFVPDKNIIGKAMLVWFSWNKEQHHVRWDRLGLTINK